MENKSVSQYFITVSNNNQTIFEGSPSSFIKEYYRESPPQWSEEQIVGVVRIWAADNHWDCQISYCH